MSSPPRDELLGSPFCYARLDKDGGRCRELLTRDERLPIWRCPAGHTWKASAQLIEEDRC